MFSSIVLILSYCPERESSVKIYLRRNEPVVRFHRTVCCVVIADRTHDTSSAVSNISFTCIIFPVESVAVSVDHCPSVSVGFKVPERILHMLAVANVPRCFAVACPADCSVVLANFLLCQFCRSNCRLSLLLESREANRLCPFLVAYGLNLYFVFCFRSQAFDSVRACSVFCYCPFRLCASVFAWISYCNVVNNQFELTFAVEVADSNVAHLSVIIAGIASVLCHYTCSNRFRNNLNKALCVSRVASSYINGEVFICPIRILRTCPERERGTKLNLRRNHPVVWSQVARVRAITFRVDRAVTTVD